MIFLNNLIILGVFHVYFVTGELLNGDKCQMKNGDSGICKLITDCPEGIDNIRKGIFPRSCGFQGATIIVCCSKTQASTEKAEYATHIVTDVKSGSPGKLSKQKCRQYSQYAWTVEENPILTHGQTDRIIYDCPIGRQKLIVGGSLAFKKEFPHMVQLGCDTPSGIKWVCAGSLISDEFVLTAALCLFDRSLEDVKYVIMGFGSEDDHRMQQFNITARIPHPSYKKPSMYHDIGLVKLHKKVEFNPWVRPACLDTSYTSSPSNVFVSWLGTNNDFIQGEAKVLMKYILRIANQSECNKSYKHLAGKETLMEGIKNEAMICASHSKEVADSCLGNSGRPIQDFNNDTKCMYDIVGVSSFGGCVLNVNDPGIYTRVSFYIKWIEEIVWPQTF